MEDQNRLMTVKEIAIFLHVSEKQVYRYAGQLDNPLPLVKLSDGATRISYKDLQSWVELQIKLKENA